VYRVFGMLYFDTLVILREFFVHEAQLIGLDFGALQMVVSGEAKLFGKGRPRLTQLVRFALQAKLN
jgi:hypothetical protein